MCLKQASTSALFPRMETLSLFKPGSGKVILTYTETNSKINNSSIKLLYSNASDYYLPHGL